MDHLLSSLLALTKETEWVEFKHNSEKPEEVGEYISSLSNAAALHEKDAGYFVWGVEDGSHRVIGTTVNPRQRKVGNEELENWLAHNLSPRVDFRFHECQREGCRMVLLQVQRAVGTPVAFKGTEWIRVGEIKKKLKVHPGKEKELWLALSRLSFETGIATAGVAGDEVLARLDYTKFFELSGQKLPANRAGILDRLAIDRLIASKRNDHFDITNLGAILFAKQLSQFNGIGRKAFRVVRYKGNTRIETEHEKVEPKGYAAGFEGLVGYINDQLPRSEVLGKALRREERYYSERAIRELCRQRHDPPRFHALGDGADGRDFRRPAGDQQSRTSPH